jgi:hypothetical protein
VVFSETFEGAFPTPSWSTSPSQGRQWDDVSDPSDPPKPEGIALIKEAARHWEVLVIFNGLNDGDATRYKVKKPKG